MRRRIHRIHPIEWLLMSGVLVAAMLVAAIGCGTTPRERVASEESWFAASVDVLTTARLAGTIDKQTYHDFVLPTEEVANARLAEMHRQAATQPSVNVDQLLAGDAAWREAKARLLQFLIQANAKK